MVPTSVLIVDYRPDHADLFETIAQDCGHQADIAYDEESAVGMLGNNGYYRGVLCGGLGGRWRLVYDKVHERRIPFAVSSIDDEVGMDVKRAGIRFINENPNNIYNDLVKFFTELKRSALQ